MWELVKAGGWLMAPLVICSIISLGIMLERLLKLRQNVVAPRGLALTLIEQLRARTLTPAALQQVKAATPLGDVLGSGIEHAQNGLDYMTLQMQGRASVQIHRLGRYLTLLGTIGSIAPLLGLLGTVVGIIESFLAVSSSGLTDPALMTTGISQALIATAAGMVVAIPAMVAHRYFQHRVVDLAVDMEEEATILTQYFYGKQALTYQAPSLHAPELNNLQESSEGVVP